MRIYIFVACLWLVTPPLWGKIVFYSNREGNEEIYTMNANGNNPARLTFNAAADSSPVWSPDGRQIAFESDRDGNKEIYLMDADGRNQRNLTNHPASDSSPTWSPDGSRIAFTSRRKNPSSLFVMEADGSNVKQITRHGRFIDKPKWSPDGTQFAFGSYSIYVINAQGRAPARLAEHPEIARAMILEGWSPDGQQLLYAEADMPADKDTLVIATLNQFKRAIIRSRRVPVPARLEMVYHSAAFSVDGKSVLFAGKWKDNNQWKIFQFRLADRRLTQLTYGAGDDFAPQERNATLSVSPQELTPTLLGKIKVTK